MDVMRVMIPISFDVHAEIKGDTTEIIQQESLLSLIFDLPNQSLVRNDERIIHMQNDCGNNYAWILIM